MHEKNFSKTLIVVHSKPIKYYKLTRLKYVRIENAHFKHGEIDSQLFIKP